tara:strand:- start:6012 stop:7124 length:1113 start_codon:yes stop_codon:yes gene_type:complete
MNQEYTPETNYPVTLSSNAIKEDALEPLRKIKKDFGQSGIEEVIDSLKGLRVLVLGDAVIDRYIFATRMGESGKGGHVSYLKQGTGTYLGLTFAIANHLAGFVENVGLVSLLGDNNQDLIHNGLKKNISPNFFYVDGELTIEKTKTVDIDTKEKKDGLYNALRLSLPEDRKHEITDYLYRSQKDFDLVLVADPQHGMIDPSLAHYISDLSEKTETFVALNTQKNSANSGYDSIHNYSQVDLVSSNENEIRKATQMRDDPIERAIGRLTEKLNGSKVNVTMGKRGIIYSDGNNIHQLTAFNQEVVDPVGTGDAVFPITSLLACKQTDPTLTPFLGNCMGAIATGITGNQRSIDSQELLGFTKQVFDQLDSS